MTVTVKSTITAVRNTVNSPTSSIAGNVASFSQVVGGASLIVAAVSTVSYYEYVDTAKRLYEEKVQPILAKPREIWVNVEENIKEAWHEKTANCPEIVGELGDFVISKIPVIAHIASIVGMSSSARALSSIGTFVTYHMMSEKDQKVVKEVEKLGIDIALFAVGIGEAGAAIKGLASGTKALSLVGSAGSAGVVVVGSAVEVEGIADVALGAIAAAVAGSDASNHVNELAEEFEESLSSKKENAGDEGERKFSGTGEYGDVGGHHVHAKAGFKGDVNYDPQKGFSISQDFMEDNGLNHQAMTAKQRELFKELAESGRPNTMAEHTRIAEEALRAGGADDELINDLIQESLANLEKQGVIKPTRIPWYSK